jgi:hypothetical protein
MAQRDTHCIYREKVNYQKRCGTIMADLTLSPDGKWMWNGSEWIPAPPIPNEPTNSQPRPSTDISDSVISINIDNNPQRNNTMANTFRQSAEIPSNLQLQTYAPGIYLGVVSLLTMAFGFFAFDPLSRLIVALIPEIDSIEIPSEMIDIYSQIELLATILLFLVGIGIIYIFVISLIGNIPPKKIWQLSSLLLSIVLIIEIIGFGIDLIITDMCNITGGYTGCASLSDSFMIVAFILIFQRTSPDEIDELSMV